MEGWRNRGRGKMRYVEGKDECFNEGRGVKAYGRMNGRGDGGSVKREERKGWVRMGQNEYVYI